MKQTKSKLMAAILPAAILMLSSCGGDKWPCVNGHGDSVTETRSLNGFTGVSNEMEATVYITQGAEFEVRIEGQQNVLDDITTKVSGSELEIYSEHCINDALPVIVYVTMPTITSLNVSGSGNMFTQNKINTTEMDIDISGSGTFTAIDTIIALNIDMQISGSGDMNLIADAPLVTSDISGSGNVSISGNGATTSTQISGSGQIHSFYFYVGTSNVDISGSGNVEINATDMIEGSISGSGNLYYKNSPIINMSVSGSGEIIHVD
jgi:hypothetical protein